MCRRKARTAHRSRTRLGALGGNRNRPGGPSRERDKTRRHTTVPGFLYRKIHHTLQNNQRNCRHRQWADPDRFRPGRSHSHRAAGCRPPCPRLPRESFRPPCPDREPGPTRCCYRTGIPWSRHSCRTLETPRFARVKTIGAGSHAGCSGVRLRCVENRVLAANRGRQIR